MDIAALWQDSQRAANAGGGWEIWAIWSAMKKAAAGRLLL
jgi:hypothetical protein